MSKKLRAFQTESGETIMIFPVSQVAITLQVKKNIPQPQPPLIQIELAGKQTWERNAADPDYIQAIRMWEQLVQIEVMERIIRRIAAKQILGEDRMKEVAELRSELEGENLPQSDKLLWLTEIAIGDDQELRRLIQTASGLADPAEEGVTQQAANFRH